MRLAIMQPYFLPYIGYFQLISAVDVFVVYDNIQYTKKGWINRNRMLMNGQATTFSLPLKKGSDYFDVCEREIADSFNRDKLLNQIGAAYTKAPFFDLVFPLVRDVISHNDNNLFGFIYHALCKTLAYLNIQTELRISSQVSIDHTLTGKDKVLAICAALGANIYINAIGGQALYSKEQFQAHNLDLRFIRSNEVRYDQFGSAFVPWLSILDVLMFNSVAQTKGLINTQYSLT